MPTKYAEGETVFVPAARLGDAGRAPYALVPRKILGFEDRSAIVNDLDNEPTKVAVRHLHPGSLGFMLLRIGDLRTEQTLLDPLAKSMLHFLRLLLPDNDVHTLSVRTLPELVQWWSVNASAISHVILIGHGTPDSIQFVEPRASVTGRQLGISLGNAKPGCSPKVFISLSCHTGKTAFAREFSRTRVCRELVAPLRSVHGAGASQYAQTLLTHHLLEAVGFAAAHRRAVAASVNGSRFRRWRDGHHEDPISEALW
ncbi:hypothetical protein [Nocardia sp. NPDC050413]|uniref:hypothetical protein n=1 Tax=Nocardia sp. NPDC050413 TaxID=3155784 RepID=UPI0033ED3535